MTLQIYQYPIKLMRASAFVITAVGLVACGGGGSGTGTPQQAALSPPPPPPPPPPVPDTVTISGTVTYDRVPLTGPADSLDFNDTQRLPVRRAPVEVLDATGGVITSTVTDESGNYSVTVNSNTDVRVTVSASTASTTGPVWNVRVVDNTSSDALYTLAGSLSSSGAASSTRSLNAGTGWGTVSYTGTRAAAPFAILDDVYQSLLTFATVDGAISFPDLQVYWSPNNVSADGDVTAGEINSSSYTRIGGTSTILILGDAADDTDEFDSSVITHEFGHFFEDRLSRSDSIGGEHSLADRLDARLAFGEAWGNTFSSIVLDDPIYRDSGQPGTFSGFSFNLENNTHANEGWFNEGAIQSVLYDVFDSNNESGDTISAGLGPFYTAFTSPQYTNTSVFTSIFVFADVLEDSASVPSAALRSMMSTQSITGTGINGAGETNTGGIASALPIYKALTIGGPAVQICSVDDAGTKNKLGVHSYLTFTSPTTGARTLTMTRTSGDTGRDPDFLVFSGDSLFGVADSSVANSEILVRNLAAGIYVIDAFDNQNTGDGGNPGDACYDFTVS